MNINTKFQHAPIVHHTNVKDHIMGGNISGHPMIEKNLFSYLKTENIYKKFREIFSIV